MHRVFGGNVKLTRCVVVVQEVDLEGVSVVEDVFGGGGVVLQLQGPQGGVVLRLVGDDVDGRLTGTVSDGEVLGPVRGT